MRLDNLPFYNAAALTPEQRRKFEELMTEAEEQRMDLIATIRAQAPG
jgi:Spy/CpxP family protein refolding chaperone